MKTKRVYRKKVKEEPVCNQYKATIKVMGKLYEAIGNSINEAILNLDILNAKGMSVLTISKGDKSQEKILPHLQTISLFAKAPLRRTIALKNVLTRFDL